VGVLVTEYEKEIFNTFVTAVEACNTVLPHYARLQEESIHARECGVAFTEMQEGVCHLCALLWRRPKKVKRKPDVLVKGLLCNYIYNWHNRRVVAGMPQRSVWQQQHVVQRKLQFKASKRPAVEAHGVGAKMSKALAAACLTMPKLIWQLLDLGQKEKVTEEDLQTLLDTTFNIGRKGRCENTVNVVTTQKCITLTHSSARQREAQRTDLL
jgi:hypothetical protein